MHPKIPLDSTGFFHFPLWKNLWRMWITRVMSTVTKSYGINYVNLFSAVRDVP